MILTVPVYATGIAPSDTGDNMCIYNVLNTYTGPANLTAGWQANTIQLKWYNGDQQLNVQSAANNCTYDSGLTIPSTAPTKTGYTFAGWKIKAGSAAVSGDLCGLTSNMIVINYNLSVARGGNGCHYCGAEDCNFGECSDIDLSTHEWKVDFSYGTLKGTASCNNIAPSYDWDSMYAAADAIWENESLTEEEKEAQSYALYAAAWANSANQSPAGTMNSSSTGRYCWCHVESYTPNGESQCSLASLPWVFSENNGIETDVDSCDSGCAIGCALDFSASDFRLALFGFSGN